MEMISIAISILSLIFSAFIFFKHEKKLKEQQIQLNDIAIQKAQQEEVDSKSAKIFLKHEKISKNHYLIITNIGKASARDVKITSKTPATDPLMRFNPSPPFEELIPEQSEKMRVIITNKTDLRIQYDISWTDDAGEQFTTQIVDYR